MNIIKKYLTINPYSRCGDIMDSVQAIAVHYYGKPLQTALACWQFFENRKLGKTDYGSSQYIIGLKGEIIQTMPETEVAYHVGSSKIDPVSGKIYTDIARARFGTHYTANNARRATPNYCMLGIECAHINDTGEMTKETYTALLELTRYLTNLYNLNANDVFTHKEIVGYKDCHKWFVDNPQSWSMFKYELRGVS